MINKVAIKSISVLKQKIANTTIVLHFKEKHPETFLFIANRLTLKKFSGLPLTFFCVAVISNLFLLFDFTEETINSKEFIAIDTFIAEFLYNIRSESLARSFYFISKLCDITAVSFIGTSLCIYFLIRKKFHFAIGILTSILGSGLSIYLGKHIFEIDRPHQFAYYQENYFSFPSGHATISVALYGLLIYFFFRNSSSFKTRIVLLSIALVFWILIGISRLYLCVHYFSDVIAGYILGFLWLLLSISIIEWTDDKIQNTHSNSSN